MEAQKLHLSPSLILAAVSDDGRSLMLERQAVTGTLLVEVDGRERAYPVQIGLDGQFPFQRVAAPIHPSRRHPRVDAIVAKLKEMRRSIRKEVLSEFCPECGEWLDGGHHECAQDISWGGTVADVARAFLEDRIIPGLEDDLPESRPGRHVEAEAIFLVDENLCCIRVTVDFCKGDRSTRYECTMLGHPHMTETGKGMESPTKSIDQARMCWRQFLRDIWQCPASEMTGTFAGRYNLYEQDTESY